MRRIGCVLALVLLGVGVVAAQTVDPVFMYANMTTGQEIPLVTGVTVSGTAIITVHVARDAGGALVGAAVDFDIQLTSADPLDFIGLHIHEAAAGVIGNIVIPTDLTNANRFSHPGGAGRIQKQVLVTDTALLGRLLANPAGFYVNIHTPANPDGVMRGQLAAAELRVFRTRLLPSNEVPPVSADASGSCSVAALATRDANGTITGGVAIFDINHRFPGAATLTGTHLHAGAIDTSAGVVIGTNLSGANPLAVTGSGSYERFVPITTALQLTNFRVLFQNPAGLYCNVHTTTFGGGIMRGQMQNTSLVLLRTALTPQQEVPPSNVQGGAAASLAAFVTRDGAGRITSGTVFFEVGHIFQSAAEFTGLTINKGAPGSNGDVIISSGLSASASVKSPTGAGDIFRLASIDQDNAAGLTALNGLINNPDQYYINLNTTVNPNGAVRGQVALAPGKPAINTGGIISAVGDTTVATAPGGIISIFGANLSATTSDAAGTEVPALPITLNGTEVRIAGRQAPLYFVSPLQINAQVPYETPEGNAGVFVVRPTDIFSAPYTLAVRRTAPAIFVAGGAAIVVKNNDFSLVTANNAAGAGDTLVIFCTGLGGTTPAVGTGRFAPLSPLATVSGVTATIGGQPAPVIGTALSPGFVGLYQVAVTMPTGVAAGNRAVVVTAGGQASNSANIAVK
jgi:uncharacterized protein (TIGR03437 family)